MKRIPKGACVEGARVSRRAVMAGIAGSALLTVPADLLARDAPANPLFQPNSLIQPNSLFQHGVASGDPDASSVVLWTRLSASGPVRVEWELGEDPRFRQILQSGVVSTDETSDHSVKVLAKGLKPGGTFYYRFRSEGAVSPVGRARTLPVGSLDRLGIALASCSNFTFGYFNAYDAIARDETIDFVLHTGDYIYEYGGPSSWGQSIAKTLGREHEPPHEIVSLADYRMRHAQYKTDLGAQAMHARHTFMSCWDDHESANNPWTGGAQNHQPAKEGDWQARRAASIRAYFEWMPVREPEWLPQTGRSRAQFWRAYRFGDLALLHTLETRHTARAKQIEYHDHAHSIVDEASAERFRTEVLGAPDRPILSPELEVDLAAALAQSVAEGQPWRIIGSPMVIGRVDVPDVAGLGLVPDPTEKLAAAKSAEQLAALAAEPAVALAWKGKWKLPDYTDAWGGYPWARERLYELSRASGAGDLVFLSGDSHSFWVNDLADAAGRPAGIEFGTAGISSPGDFIESGFDPGLSVALDKAYADHIPEVVWTDNMHQGYVRVLFGRERGEAHFVAVSTLLSRTYTTRTVSKVPFARSGRSVVFA